MKKKWMRAYFDKLAREALGRAIDDPMGPLSRYERVYSTLTVRFAEGSEPQAVSIPYLPFENRADVSLPFRVVKEEEA